MAACRVRRLPGNAQQFQRPGIHSAHVPGLVSEGHRVFRKHIQHPPVRMALFRQQIVVVSHTANPRPGGNVSFFQERGHPVNDFLKRAAAGQLYHTQRRCTGSQMAVGVDKGGHEGMSLQVHPAAGIVQEFPGLFPGSHIADDAVFFHQRLCHGPGFHGEDISVFIQSLHLLIPFRCTVFHFRIIFIMRFKCEKINTFHKFRFFPSGGTVIIKRTVYTGKKESPWRYRNFFLFGKN